MLRRASVISIAVIAVSAATVSTASAAVRPFGPEVTAAGACGQSEAGGAKTAPDGSFRGFANCGTGTRPPIRFFSRTAAGVENPSEDSGFRGGVLGVAVDTTATYVLFRTSTTISIGKRTNAGAYSSRAVDTWSGDSPAGAVIARDGRWFGVWTKQAGPGLFASIELFQGGSVEPVRRITFRPGVYNVEPALAYSGTIPVLVWTRLLTPELPGPSDIWVAKYLSGGWQSRVFASLGTHNRWPDIATAGGLTFVTWGRDGHIVVAGNLGGSFRSHTFLTGGVFPKVAASATAGPVDHVFTTWTASGGRVFFAETASSDAVTGWQGAFLTSYPVTRAFGLGSWAGKATVVYSTDTSVRLRAQV